MPLCEDGDGREVDGTNRTEYVAVGFIPRGVTCFVRSVAI